MHLLRGMGNLFAIMQAQFYLKPEFKANIYAHAFSFLINIVGYGITLNFFFIWVELASLCFIGYHNTKSPTFFDRNIQNHFITIICFYSVAHLIGNNDYAYLILVFAFTYFYFILRYNGYNKSNQIWVYIQALLIGTTFINFPFYEKIGATILGYVEAQLILNLSFWFFANNLAYEIEKKYLEVFKMSVQDWFDVHKPAVKLAIRGSVTASVLYAMCLVFHDIKPNWAVVVAVSCLQRDDNPASIRAIKGIAIGSIIGWPLSYAVTAIFSNHLIMATVVLWVMLLAAVIVSFEQITKPTLIKQIIITILFLIITTCIAIGLDVSNYNYVHLKIINSLIGAFVAFIVVLLWQAPKIIRNSI